MTKESRVVLIADDTVFFRSVLKDMFEKAGFIALTASDGQEALQKIRDNLTRLDAAVVDLLMPKLSGFDVIREVRKLEAGRILPLVAVTSVYHKESQMDMLRELNTDGYLEKSIPPEEVVYFVNNLIYPKDKNARRSLRIVVHFMLEYKVHDSLFRAFAYTLSDGGMFIRTTHLLPEGTSLQIAFTLPGDDTRLILEGVVVHAQSTDSFSLCPPGMGVRFTRITSEQAKLIYAYIESQMWNRKATAE